MRRRIARLKMVAAEENRGGMVGGGYSRRSV